MNISGNPHRRPGHRWEEPKVSVFNNLEYNFTSVLHILLVQGDDWEGIYANNELVYQGHSYDMPAILEKVFRIINNKIVVSFLDIQKRELTEEEKSTKFIKPLLTVCRAYVEDEADWETLGFRLPDKLEELKEKLPALKITEYVGYL